MTCGPEVMMRYVAQAAERRGIPESNIWVALERNMNCAIGLCGHCQLGPEFLCKDGPVLPYDRVAPWLRVQGF
jgi:NAD(P)H-flavin reductase